MSENRQPVYTLLLRKRGKRNQKIELFLAEDFEHKRLWVSSKPVKYRLRVNGKWHGHGKKDGYTFMTKWQFRDKLWSEFFN